MKIEEFKAWFQGFCENMDGPPSAEQWKKIKANVANIDNVATPIQFIEHHYRDYNTFWPRPYQVWCSSGANDGLEIQSTMADMGRADAAMLTAG